MVKGMLLIHVGIVLLLGCVASSPSSCVLSLPLRCCHVLYPGHVVVTCCILVVLLFVVTCCILVMLLSRVISWSCCCSTSAPPCCHLCRCCHRLVVIVLTCCPRMSWLCRPCPSRIVIVPHHRSVVMLCVSKVGWNEWRGVLTRVP